MELRTTTMLAVCLALLGVASLTHAQTSPTTTRTMRGNSCSDYKIRYGQTKDGKYTIFVQDDVAFEAYCVAMATSKPLMYISLVAGGTSSNFATYYKNIGRKTVCAPAVPSKTWAKYGTTYFTKIPVTAYNKPVPVKSGLMVNLTLLDFNGAAAPLTRYTSSMGQFIKYGTAGDMFLANYSTTCLRGAFKIDLTGTPWGIDPNTTWSWTGTMLNRQTTLNTPQLTGSPTKTTGPVQVVSGKCGGFPGTCMPVVNNGKAYGIRMRMVSPCAPTDGSLQPCYNGGTCIATTAIGYKCECPLGWSGTTCQTPEADMVVQGKASAARDDSSSTASCPAGTTIRQCQCDIAKCDGAFVDTKNALCTARASYFKQATKAQVSCPRWNPAYVSFKVVRNPGSGYGVANKMPKATCAAGSTLVGCSVYSPWYVRDAYGKGDISADKKSCTKSCPYLSTTKNCVATATCLTPICLCYNGGTCNLYTGVCTCPVGYVGTRCQTFDYCQYELERTRKPPCLHGGECTAPPTTVVATTGGDNTGRDCIFPFTWQGKQYSSCISSNNVGPPFACGIHTDGNDDYVDLGGYFPGIKASYEIWVKPAVVKNFRETIIGNLDSCLDAGILISYGKFAMVTKPPNGGCSVLYASTVAATIGQWHHVVLTMDGTFMKLYVNATKILDQRYFAKYVPSAKGMFMGTDAWCGTGCSDKFEGTVKMARIYQGELSTSAISNGAKNGAFNIDDSVRRDNLIAYHEFGNDAPLNLPGGCQGTDHKGLDWIIIKDNTQVVGVHCNVRDFIVPAGVAANVKPWTKFSNNTASKVTGGQYGTFEVYAKNIYIYGTVTAWGAGMTGGPTPPSVKQAGYRGFGTQGIGVQSTSRKAGAGGGGAGDPASRSYGKSGGGGGYGSNGANGIDKSGSRSGVGQGGGTYGTKELKTLLLGSGGGSGGNDNALNDNPPGGYGGRGGGAIRLDAREKLYVTGAVNAMGQPGQGDAQSTCNTCPTRGTKKTQCTYGCSGLQTTACWDYSGAGGGGSGGSIYLRGEEVLIGSLKVNARGGRGGYGARQCGGGGGNGRIRIDYAYLSGTTSPTAYVQAHNETFANLALSALRTANKQVFVYRGCYLDSSTRLLPYVANNVANSQAGQSMTPAYCVSLCKAQGYAYAGVQYSYQCYCGNNIDAFPKKAEGDCNSKCNGDTDQRCGGGWRLTVYGPMPETTAHTYQGAKQDCKPWCRVGWLAKTSTTAGRPQYGYCSGLQALTSFNIKCNCPAGKTGAKCENDCPAGKFGKGCTSTCLCKNKGTCDVATGACSCAPGWRGKTCTAACATGTFGPNCASKCNCNLFCTPTSCDANHSRSFEAETGILGFQRPAQLRTDSRASAGKYLLVTASNAWSSAKALVIANYTVTVTVAQQYRVWFRVFSPLATTDSLYYAVDGSTPRTCFVSQNNGFVWRKCNTFFNLKVGTHKLTIFNREKGLGIDKIFIGTDHPAGTCDAVTGTCSCNPGYVGPTCSNVCQFNYFGAGCVSKCNCQNDAVCSPIDGSCTCLAGWAGAICDQKCGTGSLVNRYGQNCNQQCQCQNGAGCNHYNGTCSCQAGFKGIFCELPCSVGTYGPECTMTCTCKNGGQCNPATGACQCPAGYGGLDCGTQCSAYTYGVNCFQKCTGCPHGTTSGCDHVTGACKCMPGVTGLFCNITCPVNTFGQGCSQKCCCGNNRAKCDAVTGICACRNGWQGACCGTTCKANTYGPGCTAVCACQNGGTCNRFNGACTCASGYTKLDCSQLCNATTPIGKYGVGCRSTVKCVLANTASYDSRTGACVCKAGFGGLLCSAACPAGQHGAGCFGSCGCLNGGQCHAVHGTCDCQPGWHDATCSSTCGAGTYGYNCALTCACQNGATCDAKTGACTCKAGYQGSTCDTQCTPGSWGANCASTCKPCIFGNCNAVTGVCECTDGYTGTNCTTQCTLGFWGKACSQFCNCPVGASCNNTNGACKCVAAGKAGANCDQACPGGKYGVGCVAHCPACSANYSLGGCDGVSGSCLCKDGFTGPLCQQSCPQGTYGSNCSKMCSCVNGACHPDLGYCVCSPGFMGATCQTSCPAGKYGQNCLLDCLCLPPRGTCDSVAGTCTCLAGYHGLYCEQTCPSNLWGVNCLNPCTNCNPSYGTCDHVSGVCHCNPGKTGSGCSQTCKNGTWGVGCNETCQCVHGTCDPIHGSCACNAGYVGTTCRDNCPTGFFGAGCLHKCDCMNNATCDHLNGDCDCPPGYIGSDCGTPCAPTNFGHNCYQTCSCKNGAPCDTATGFCSCTAGWQGLTCDTPCAAGTWGPHCANVCPFCLYQSAGTCNVTTGACQCDPGYQQPFCNETCATGSYGVGCTSVCACSGPGSTCFPQNGTCLCGGSHLFCKFGHCDPVGYCICDPGYNSSDCETPCSHGFYGAQCQQKCGCDEAADCDNIDGACTCPGTVIIAGVPQVCNGKGTSCSTQGVCTCTAGYYGLDCSEACPLGKYGFNCASDCRPCGKNLVCSPIDGTCVAHCSAKSLEICQNNGICDKGSGRCNCSSTGYRGTHCETGILPVSLQNLKLYKTQVGLTAEAVWTLPSNLANYSNYSPVISILLIDISGNTMHTEIRDVTTTSRVLMTIPNHYYSVSFTIKSGAGGGVPVTRSFSANLLCLPADNSVTCAYQAPNCGGKCDQTKQFCDSQTGDCLSQCHIQNNCKYGTCVESTGHCACNTGYGGVHCDTYDTSGTGGTGGNTGESTGTNGSSGISTGAIVGIVLGAIALVALVAVLVGVVHLRKETQKQPTAGGAIDVQSGQVQYDASGDSVGFSNPVYSAPAQAPVKDNPLYESQEVLDKE